MLLNDVKLPDYNLEPPDEEDELDDEAPTYDNAPGPFDAPEYQEVDWQTALNAYEHSFDD